MSGIKSSMDVFQATVGTLWTRMTLAKAQSSALSENHLKA